MTITPRVLNTNFNDALYLFLTAVEGPIPFVYKDGKGIPTIGVGYALISDYGTGGVHDWRLTENYQPRLLQAVPTLTQTQLDALGQKLQSAADSLNGVSGGSNPFPKGTGTNILDWSMTGTQIHALFNNTISTYETQVQTWLGGAKWAGDTATIYDRLQGTQEMFALTSLAFNGLLNNSPTLKQDILNGNRAEAWYEIRYGSNGGKDPNRGVAKRRYYESEMFGLYNDPAAPTLDEAKQAYQMLQLHRPQIMKYEGLYGLTPEGVRGTSHPTTGTDQRTGLELAQSLGTSVLLLPTQKVSTIVESFNDAKMAILADLGANADPDVTNAYQAWVTQPGNDPVSFLATNLYLDPGRDSTSQLFDPNHAGLLDARKYNKTTGAEIASNDILIGEGGTDMLVGGKGNDLLIGGAGDDVLWGGGGNDVMAGGAGNDIYILSGGGTYTLEDKQGFDRILFNGNAVYSFITQADGSMVSPDGLFTAAWSGTDLVVTDVATNETATLNRNFTSGDFGITLHDAPVDPVIATTITGDISPDDIDPNTAGIQAASDANGNPIGTAQAYEDILRGTAADDHILSGDLGDNVGGGAGNDWIEAGTGSDYVNGGDGLDLIEGGTGADILAGDAGNDQIFGNVKISETDAIANGNADIATHLKGDWLSGGAGDDTLIAGADNDVLAGGGGNDLIIAGAGDDHILGDADYTVQFILEATPRYQMGGVNWYHTSNAPFDWTITQQPDSTVFAPATGATNPADFGNDIIYAGEGADKVWAGDGNDVVYGEGGNDTVIGEAGNDIVMGGAGDDTLHGDASYINAAQHGDDYLDGGDGNDTLYGNGGNDILIGGNNNDTLWGGTGNDTLMGDAGDDHLYGEQGTNYLDGGDGNDILNSGGPGSELYGGAGNDDISAANGGNYLDGEDGNDTLAASGGDNTLFGIAANDPMPLAA